MYSWKATRYSPGEIEKGNGVAECWYLYWTDTFLE